MWRNWSGEIISENSIRHLLDLCGFDGDRAKSIPVGYVLQVVDIWLQKVSD